MKKKSNPVSVEVETPHISGVSNPNLVVVIAYAISECPLVMIVHNHQNVDFCGYWIKSTWSTLFLLFSEAPQKNNVIRCNLFVLSHWRSGSNSMAQCWFHPTSMLMYILYHLCTKVNQYTIHVWQTLADAQPHYAQMYDSKCIRTSYDLQCVEINLYISQNCFIKRNRKSLCQVKYDLVSYNDIRYNDIHI